MAYTKAHKRYYEKNKAKCNAATRAWEKRNWSKRLDMAAKWRGENPSKVKAAFKKWWNSTGSKQQRHKLYGLSEGEYLAMLDRQGYQCAICKTDLKTPCIDHCHSTGAVRGVLCRNCNLGIGLLGDNAERIYSAALYLTPAIQI